MTKLLFITSADTVLRIYSEQLRQTVSPPARVESFWKQYLTPLSSERSALPVECDRRSQGSQFQRGQEDGAPSRGVMVAHIRRREDGEGEEAYQEEVKLLKSLSAGQEILATKT
jgi:hypothetical protein